MKRKIPKKIKEKLKKLGLNIINYETIIETGKKYVDEEDKEILQKEYRKVDDVVLTCYTSGTTDNPKLVMVSSRSLILTSNFMYNIRFHLTGHDKTISFLPFGHLILFSVNVVIEVQIGDYSGNISRLSKDAQEL